MRFRSNVLLAWCLCLTPPLWAAVQDTPFRQPVAVRFDVALDLKGAGFQRLVVDAEGVAYVLTDRGVARVFDNRLALDKSFRPLTGKRCLDVAESRQKLFYLFEDRLLSNSSAGRPLVRLPERRYSNFAIGENGAALLVGPTNLGHLSGATLLEIEKPEALSTNLILPWRDRFFLVTAGSIVLIKEGSGTVFHKAEGVTALAADGATLLVGTQSGYYALDAESGRETLPLQGRLPAVHVTSLAPTASGLWVGTMRGAFLRRPEGAIDYYASKRWLLDDEVMALQPDPSGDLFVLTKTGLNKIEFREMTLAQKAAHYDRKIRQRHIRMGFCAELHLPTAGDITSAQQIDTDNDGTWTEYYLASQAFRFAVTRQEAVRRHVWETFEAMERLETINGLEGFPSRSFERTGFKTSDIERWHLAPDPDWEWKGTTSSDEITAHTFGCAVLYETVAESAEEKQRVVRFYEKIINHILRHKLYLVDKDGKPTLWGRWNPEYVNGYPHSIGDRRLNSAEIIAMLQFAHHITGKALYREKAFELLNEHGYLQNITNSMRNIAPTPGFVFQGNDMGSEWNHSDDLLAFVTYWVLHRYAFNEDLRSRYAAAIKDHWEMEKNERCPLWNFVYASTGAKEFDVEGALWTLRGFPLDMVSWSVDNSHRKDIHRLPENFRHQQLQELLPPTERPMTRWNTQPFRLAGGDNGHIELAGDEFLLPYWMGRYLRVIE